MIAYLRGKLISRTPGSVIVDVGGIGYRVRISNHTFEHLPSSGQECILHIYHHISENDQQLFGFAANEEKNLFEMLITVKSIGPRLALALLSAMPPHQIVNAIVNQQTSLISKSPGIGKKSAERIVLELRDKLGDIAAGQEILAGKGTIQQETISALESLGYSRVHALKAVQSVISSDQSEDNVSVLLKKALKHLQ